MTLESVASDGVALDLLGSFMVKSAESPSACRHGSGEPEFLDAYL
jgi:hypothetical protein